MGDHTYRTDTKPEKPASTLLLESATPFDRACMMVQELELAVRHLLQHDGGEFSHNYDATEAINTRRRLAELICLGTERGENK